MAAKKVGVLVKEARAAAGLTQEKLAKAAGEGLIAADISKCERGEADLTPTQLKKIAVACGVTQTSLVNAPKNLPAAKKPAAKKTETTTAKKPAASAKKPASTTAAKKPASSAKKPATTTAAKKPATPAGANTTMKVTATEKKLVEAYREATADAKKTALKVLKGEYSETATNLLNVAGGSGANAIADGIGDTLGNLIGSLIGGK